MCWQRLAITFDMRALLETFEASKCHPNLHGVLAHMALHMGLLSPRHPAYKLVDLYSPPDDYTEDKIML